MQHWVMTHHPVTPRTIHPCASLGRILSRAGSSWKGEALTGGDVVRMERGSITVITFSSANQPMATFTYTARAVNGDLKSATIDAPTRDDVIKQLRQLRLNVVKIDEGSAQKKKRMSAIKMRDIVI